MSSRSISLRDLRAECDLLERAVVGTKASTTEQLAAHRPGGSDNPEKDARAWLSYYRHLHRAHAVVAQRETAAPSALASSLADAKVIDALRSAPVPVEILNRAPTDRPLYVYAKSFDALVHVHGLDRQLAWMVDRHAALVASPSAEAKSLLPQALDAIAYTYQLLAWIVTTPGVGMPYAADDDRPEPPAEIRALEPWDLVRIIEAHHTHLSRLHAITALLDPRTPDQGGTRPSWSGFFASLELESGASAETLMKARALAAVLASNRLGAGLRADAYDAAKRESEAQR